MMSEIFDKLEDIWDFVSGKWEDISDWFSDLFDDYSGVKRMQLLCATLTFLLLFVTFATINRTKHIEAQTLEACDIIYGIGGDSARLASGVKVEILAHRKPKYGNAPLYWVQVEDGQRGYVPQVNLEREFIALSAMESLDVKQFDNVEIVPHPDPEQKSYIAISQSGEREEIDFNKMSNFVSVTVNNKLSNYERGGMTNFISKERFERRFMGRNINYKYADYVRSYGADSTVVLYGLKLLNKEVGSRGVFSPEVTFVDGVAQSYRLVNQDKINGNAAFLVKMPLSGFILDHLGWIIADRYGFTPELKPTTLARESGWVQKLLFFTVVIFVLLLGAVWLIYMNHLLPTLIFSMLPYKTPLYRLKNRALHSLIISLLFINTYIWFTLLMAYGAIWWIVPPVVLYATYRVAKNFYAGLVTPPSFRCDNCKDIESKYRSNRRFVRNYTDTVHRRVLTRKVTVTGSKGGREDGVTRFFNNYKEVYSVDVYEDTYICATCEQSEKVQFENRKLISRTLTGCGMEHSAT